jgi:hypothetical protein
MQKTSRRGRKSSNDIVFTVQGITLIFQRSYIKRTLKKITIFEEEF